MSAETMLVKNDKNQWVIGLDVLNAIKTRNSFGNPFKIGETIKLIPSSKPNETVAGVEVPVFDIGQGRTINLASLANFIIQRDDVPMSNVGTEFECLTNGQKPYLLQNWMIDNGGIIPQEITIAARVKDGTTLSYVKYDSDTEPLKRAAYKARGIDVDQMEQFPMLIAQKGKDAWKFVERVVVSAA